MNIYVILYIATYLLARQSGDGMVLIQENLVPILVSAFATLAAAAAWRSAPPDERDIWKWLTLGIGLWAAAEIIWAGMVFAWGEDVPYPSLADALWIVGYMPVGIAIIEYLAHHRFRLTHVKAAAAIIGGVILPLAALIYFIQPILEKPLDIRLSELVVKAVYPSLDILVATGGVLCLMLRKQSIWQDPWALIGGSLVIWAYSDLWYWLLSYFGIYAPDWFSAVRVDIPYGLAYVALGVGCLRAMSFERSAKTVSPQ